MNDSDTNLVCLLREAQKGDEKSLVQLCEELKQFIQGYFLRKFQDEDIAEELSQETYLRFLRNFPLIKDPMKLKNFVLKVTLRVALDYHRQNYRGIDSGLVDVGISHGGESMLLGSSPNTHSPSDNVLNKVDVERALRKLPRQTQKILRMKAEGYKYEEIAELNQVSLSTVKMQVTRGIDKLKKLLTDVTF